MKKLLCVMLLAGCATTTASPKDPVSGGGVVPSKDQAALAQVRAALQALPRCEAGAKVGALSVRATICTKMFCGEACCNQCSWAATFESKSGQAQPVDPAQVKELLHVTAGALDCEIAAWAQALQGQSLSLEAPACVVR